MDYIGLIIIFFVIVSSILQKLQEQKAMRNAKEKKEKTRPEDLPEETRRMLYGPSGKPKDAQSRSDQPTIREAKPKTARQARPQTDPARELMESVLGNESEEGDWVPVPPKKHRDVVRRTGERQPASRTEPHTLREKVKHQREVLERKLVQQLDPSKTHEPPPIQRQRTAQPKSHESKEIQRRKLLAERERRKQQRAAAQRQQSQRQKVPHVAPRPLHKNHLFTDLHDVRRAIVVAEVLGKPRGLQDEIEAWK